MSGAAAEAEAEAAPAQEQPYRALVCLDGHDQIDGAPDVVSWLTAHQPQEGLWRVHVFGHVHNDSSIPLVKKLGNLLGVTTTKEERAAALAARVAELAKDLVARGVAVTTHVDASPQSMMETYRQVAAEVRPTLLVLNERTDSDALFNPFGSESAQLQQAVGKRHSTSVMIVKKRLPAGPFCMHYIVLVDPEFSASSQRAVEGCGRLMATLDEDGAASAYVSILSVWDLPDVATAMYSTDDRWKEEKRKLEKVAHRAGNAAQQLLKSLVPRRFECAIHTSNDALCAKIDRLVKKVRDTGVAAFHNVVVGGGRAAVGEQPRGVSQLLGRAGRKVFGSTADAVVAKARCSAVTITY
eukprot:TRINITY_DN33103_c0_g1_i1.p1 TRINITY_DN33103_c0_g1~~TRINITY_DN33103_c0_g1_i1.p1  ORF type:complete len:354 (+),score=134.47 TRINITY_DN33103_c0_g1_i1:105-1166(+)